MVAVSLGQLYCLTRSLPQEIQLCSSCFAASYGLDVHNIRRIKRKDSLDALIAGKPPHGEHFVDSSAFAGDDRAGEYLDSFLIAFLDFAVHVNYVTYLKIGHIFFQAFDFYRIKQLCFHRSISCVYTIANIISYEKNSIPVSD